MCANVPLAAAVAHGQDQARHPERSLVSLSPATSLGEPAWEAFYALVYVATEGTARPLPTATEVVLLRVCQEALTNVRKHAAATRVDIRLRYAASTVELTVADNGRGFTATVGPAAATAIAEAAGVGAAGVVGAAGSVAGTRTTGTTNTTAAAVATVESGATATGAVTGFGLRGMGERLRQVGGTLTVATAPGAGTTIRAEVSA